jgi:hypothetical protein
LAAGTGQPISVSAAKRTPLRLGQRNYDDNHFRQPRCGAAASLICARGMAETALSPALTLALHSARIDSKPFYLEQ